jgi:predicted esterase
MKSKWSVAGVSLSLAIAGVGCGGGSSTADQGFGQGSSGAGSGSSGGTGSSGGSGSGGSSGGSGSGGSSSGFVQGTSSGASGGGSSSGSANPGDATTGSSGGTSSGAGSSSGVTTSGSGPTIPAVSGTCPTLATGNITVLGQTVQLFVGAKQTSVKGPVLFYWHGTGSSSAEAQGIMGTQIAEITGQGGIVASFSTSTKMGTDVSGDGVWYMGDFAMADQILACAVQQLNIDTRRIYSAGCSAGGLATGGMAYARSSYLAAVMPNSGGVVFAGTLQNSHVPAVITTHGGTSDMVVVSFATTSATLDNDIKAKGGFVVDCNHGGGHCAAPANDIAGQWQFCKDHPFGVSPEPYASGLPASLPSYCTKI